MAFDSLMPLSLRCFRAFVEAPPATIDQPINSRRGRNENGAAKPRRLETEGWRYFETKQLPPADL